MLKRSLILISIVAAALLTLAGCSQATDGDTVYAGRHDVFGSVDAEKLQAAADSARAAGEPLIFAAEGTDIAVGPGLVDLTGVTVRIEGPVTTHGTSGNAVILNAAKAASLTFTGRGELALGDYDVLIYAGGMDLAKAGPNSQKVLYTADLADITGAVAAVAVDDFTVDDGFTKLPAGVEALYVLGTVSVLPSAATALSGASLYALGEVALKGNSVTVLADSSFVFTSTARLVNGTNGPVKAAVGATFSIEEIDVGGPTTGITLSGVTTLKLGKLSGAGGPFSVPATTTTIAIGGGDGDLVISDGSTAVTLAADFTNKSTGKTTFDTGGSAATTLAATGSLDIAGDVEFTGAVVTGATSGDLKFGGKVILPDGKTITLTNAASNLILRPGAAICVGDTPLLTAITETTLDAAEDGVSLTVAETDSVLTLTKDLTSLAGKAQVEPGVTLVLAADTDLPLAADAALVFAAEPAATVPVVAAAKPSVLKFSHASSSRLVLGLTAGTNPTVTGGYANNTLNANDAAVTFSTNAITGAEIGAEEAGAKLASDGADTALAITLAAAGSSLTLDGVNLDLQSFGSVVLTGGTAGTGVILKGGANPGKITLDTSATAIDWDANVKGKYLNDGTQKAQITGNGGVAAGSADSDTATIGFIAGGELTPDNDVKITQHASSNVIIKKTAALAATL